MSARNFRPLIYFAIGLVLILPLVALTVDHIRESLFQTVQARVLLFVVAYALFAILLFQIVSFFFLPHALFIWKTVLMACMAIVAAGLTSSYLAFSKIVIKGPQDIVVDFSGTDYPSVWIALIGVIGMLCSAIGYTLTGQTDDNSRPDRTRYL